MSLDDLLAAMRAESDEEIARLERESRHEEAKILNRAAEEARTAEEKLLREAEARLGAELARNRARVRLEALRILRESREDAFGELLEEVRERLAALRDGNRYGTVLAELLRESQAALPEARRLLVDPRDQELVREPAASARLELRAELETIGGLELESDDGRRLRNTLETRLAAAESRLRLRFAALAAELDGPPASKGSAA